MDTDTVVPAPSVRKVFVTLPIRVPATCPWSEHQIRAALTCFELHLDPTIHIQRYNNNGGVRLILHDAEVLLPPSIGKFIVGGTHPYLTWSEWEEVTRGLCTSGLRLAFERSEVTIPYSFFSITI